MTRQKSYGQAGDTTALDRLGVWLSGRAVRREVGSFTGIAIGDFGCGYHASLIRSVVGQVHSATLADVAIAKDLVQLPNVTVIEGELPGTLEQVPSASLDVALCLSVLEHLDQPEVALSHFRRVLRPGGTCLINVPTWMGKRFLELSAFGLGLSPAREMDDHRRYYDPRDLWPLLVDAGFPPHAIRCRRHKFGLNTIATCRNEEIIT
jgi:SAM-dependent methyltransferase